MSNHSYTCDCGCMGFGPALNHLLSSVGAGEARDHFRAARVEFLKSVRAIIDSRIDYLSKKRQTEGTTVPVE